MMGATTGIDWTDATWNCIRGCTRVSAGCVNCYAEVVASRFSGPGQPYEGLAKRVNGHARWTNKVRFIPEHLDDPMRWRKPRRIFVNSMSDLFHPDIEMRHLAAIWSVMALCPRHTFQILTKRPERITETLGDPKFYPALRAQWEHAINANRLDREALPLLLDPACHPLPNVWIGCSVEDQKAADTRIPVLLGVPAAVRFLSCEPLLGPIDLARYLPRHVPRLPGVDWVIAGGESGPGHRPMDLDWARSLRDQCRDAGVAFWFKQIGGITPKANGKELDGVEWCQFPEVAA